MQKWPVKWPVNSHYLQPCVSVPDEIEDFGVKRFLCNICGNKSLSSQSLAVHKLSCEEKAMAKENVKPLSNEMTFIEINSNDIKNIEPVVKTVIDNLVKMLKRIKLML